MISWHVVLESILTDDHLDLCYYFGFKLKVKVGVLRLVQQPGSFWDRPTAFATEVTECDLRSQTC